MSNALMNNGPLIIGGTGGSGTRAIAKILMLSERVYLGRNHNRALDCLDFKPFYDRCIPQCLSNFYSDSLEFPYDFSSLGSVQDSFKECFSKFMDQTTQSDFNSVWGWKGPRSMYLLPFFHYSLPKLKFLHVVRDGRDMAYSANQNQLHLYGDLSLGANECKSSPAVRSIVLWEKANMTAANYARSHMPEQYLCIRYEDLVFDQDQVLIRIATFLGIEEALLFKNKHIITPSESIGRWRQQNYQEVVKKGSRGLYYFGYDTID